MKMDIFVSSHPVTTYFFGLWLLHLTAQELSATLVAWDSGLLRIWMLAYKWTAIRYPVRPRRPKFQVGAGSSVFYVFFLLFRLRVFD